MLDYRISSLAELPQTLASFKATHLVSLVDPGAHAPQTIISSPRHLILYVHDLDVIDDGSLPGNPNPTHLSHLLTFTRNWLGRKHVRAVFQCTAGKRRSTACALLADITRHLDTGTPASPDLISSCWDRLLTLRPKADPNKALLSLGDNSLSLQGLLTAHAKAQPRFLDLSQN